LWVTELTREQIGFQLVQQRVNEEQAHVHQHNTPDPQDISYSCRASDRRGYINS